MTCLFNWAACMAAQLCFRALYCAVQTENMAAMSDGTSKTETPTRTQVRRRAKRAQWACGLCFGLLFLMGLSGIASITLLYDTPMYRSGVRGFEGAVMDIVVALKQAIRLLHAWGGYVGILLSGWAGLEVFSYGRLLKRTGDSGWRRTGRMLGPLGLFGAAVLIASLLLLIPSGVAAQGYLKVEAAATETPAPVGLQRPSHNEATEGDSRLVEWHTRELNYLMALGAILLVFAAASIRRVSIEAREDGVEAKAESQS